MLTVFQALHKGGNAGTPLPAPYETLKEGGVRHRLAQMSMIAGKPGACKSMFALNLLTRWRVPTLYFAADSDPISFTKRLLALEQGSPISQFEGVRPDRVSQSLLERTSYLRARFSAPSLENIDTEVTAFDEVHGEPPTVIVVDNLLNLVLDWDMEFAAMLEVLRRLDELAQETRAHVMVLHHTKESFSKPAELPPMGAVRGQINQIPRMILTLAKAPDFHELRLAVVKNTHGRADESGNYWTPFLLSEEHASVTDIKAGGKSAGWQDGAFGSPPVPQAA